MESHFTSRRQKLFAAVFTCLAVAPAVPPLGTNPIIWARVLVKNEIAEWPKSRCWPVWLGRGSSVPYTPGLGPVMAGGARQYGACLPLRTRVGTHRGNFVYDDVMRRLL